MRSKEVEAVINKIEKFKTEKCLYKCFDDSDWQEASVLLSYIQQLEIMNLNNTERIRYLERSCDRKESTIIELEFENNCVSKDKIRELRDIDNIDLIQCKLQKLLNEQY